MFGRAAGSLERGEYRDRVLMRSAKFARTGRPDTDPPETELPEAPARVGASSAGKLSRAEKHDQIRKALFDAAVKVVGAEGYSAAMVSAITAKAGVAQGTFYNYFESRQDLFDQLLPRLGREMLEFVKTRSADAPNDLERERKGFKAFFEFLLAYPEFYRILYESELFAPEAFRRHFSFVTDGYLRVLRRAQANGELKPYDPREIEAIATILMGSREYLCMKYARSDGQIAELPDFVVDAYMKLVTGGIWSDPNSNRRARAPRRRARGSG